MSIQPGVSIYTFCRLLERVSSKGRRRGGRGCGLCVCQLPCLALLRAAHCCVLLQANEKNWPSWRYALLPAGGIHLHNPGTSVYVSVHEGDWVCGWYQFVHISKILVIDHSTRFKRVLVSCRWCNFRRPSCLGFDGHGSLVLFATVGWRPCTHSNTAGSIEVRFILPYLFLCNFISSGHRCDLGPWELTRERWESHAAVRVFWSTLGVFSWIWSPVYGINLFPHFFLQVCHPILKSFVCYVSLKIDTNHLFALPQQIFQLVQLDWLALVAKFLAHLFAHFDSSAPPSLGSCSPFILSLPRQPPRYPGLSLYL